MEFSGSNRGQQQQHQQSNFHGNTIATNNNGLINGNWDQIVVPNNNNINNNNWEELNNNNNNNNNMDWTATSSVSSTPCLYGTIPHAPPASLYGGGGSHAPTDPHLVCLKLGKRDYFEDHITNTTTTTITRNNKNNNYKKGKGKGIDHALYGGASMSVPRCQVEGCHVALVNAKDYHRRHKVCEPHSKAPMVVVLGLDQRFCQQCSRFHVVSEFEEAKRSCKRRLAGHNERRRKGSHDSIARNSSFLGGGFPYVMSSATPPLAPGRAHSLLSYADLSSRSSAALRELIAENRAANLARQLTANNLDHQNHHYFDQTPPNPDHVTLDLMQAPGPASFGFAPLSRVTSKDQDCSDMWNSF